MYNLYTAFVTISVLMFVAIYNTSFITVVTLGGTVLGCAFIGFLAALSAFLLRRSLHNRPARYLMETIGCGCIIGVTAASLPGWKMKPDVAMALFLSALCFTVSALNEYILNENTPERPG